MEKLAPSASDLKTAASADVGSRASVQEAATYTTVQKGFFRRCLRKLELENTADVDPLLGNYQLLPVPAKDRNWGKWTCKFFLYFFFVLSFPVSLFFFFSSLIPAHILDTLFWFGECASVTSWTVAATGVQGGLVRRLSPYPFIQPDIILMPPVLVGIVDLCYAWPLYCFHSHGPRRTRRCRVSNPLPSDQPCFVWNLGLLLACIQPQCHDRYLDRCAGNHDVSGGEEKRTKRRKEKN